MQVAFRVSPDAHGGSGIFSTEAIPAGTMVWSFDHANPPTFDDRTARQLCDAAVLNGDITSILRSSYFMATDHTMLVDLRGDSGRFFNHSAAKIGQNVALGSEMAKRIGARNGVAYEQHSAYALRDIPAETELLDDYTTFGANPPWYDTLLSEHGVDESYLTRTAAESQPAILLPTPARSNMEI
jgi:hypothetical protein